jgi:hypothetical protein
MDVSFIEELKFQTALLRLRTRQLQALELRGARSGLTIEETIRLEDLQEEVTRLKEEVKGLKDLHEEVNGKDKGVQVSEDSLLTVSVNEEIPRQGSHRDYRDKPYSIQRQRNKFEVMFVPLTFAVIPFILSMFTWSYTGDRLFAYCIFFGTSIVLGFMGKVMVSNYAT